MLLDQRVVIITGAASGIGRASALRFAQEGALLVLNDLDEGALLGVAGEIAQLGGEALPLPGDVAQVGVNENLVQQAMMKYGRLDVVFGNAGIVAARGIIESTEEFYDQVMDVNFRSLFRLSKAALPIMMEQHSGVILFTASKVALVAQRKTPLYCASKGAVVMLAKALALDFAPYNVRVNAICPGVIDTKLLRDYIDRLPDPEAGWREFSAVQPLNRLGTAEECAEAALFLCSDASSFITGVALPVDGGFTAE